ncbi:MAG: alpha/beta hydrolase-fold protein [Archangium sp.]|nr:alpha/beta hydrolase-fold protein [Archangium sp.]MDP3576145.1 alpha/beta hydrolase-fold protein [Archangium sp.]
MPVTTSMRTSVLFVSLFLLACGAPPELDAGVTPDAGAPDAGLTTTDAGTPDAGIVTVLRVKYPAGTRAVFARGSKPPFTWNTGLPMVKVDDTTWSLSVTTLKDDLEWKPLLDDATWSKGPNYIGRLGAVNEVAPRFFRDAGEWTRRWPTFTSTLLGNTRGIYVYLPPTYLENTAARMPVVYMHDGQNLFDPNAAFGGVTWGVPQTMDTAANDGRFREAIVVGAENAGGARISEYTPTSDPMYGGGNGDLYLRMLVEELKPRVDAELRTKPSREDTVLIGSSLGGLISSHAGVRKADTFGLIGAMSPSVWWDSRVLLTTVSQTTTPRPIRVYVDSGDSGNSNDGVTDTRELAAAYRTLGYVEGSTLKHVVQPGATHTESAWASRLPGALEFLLGPGR